MYHLLLWGLCNETFPPHRGVLTQDIAFQASYRWSDEWSKTPASTNLVAFHVFLRSVNYCKAQFNKFPTWILVLVNSAYGNPDEGNSNVIKCPFSVRMVLAAAVHHRQFHWNTSGDSTRKVTIVFKLSLLRAFEVCRIETDILVIYKCQCIKLCHEYVFRSS